MDDVIKCESCGCCGNGSCGHNPPQWALDNGSGCALDAAGFCSCCRTKEIKSCYEQQINRAMRLSRQAQFIKGATNEKN